MRHGGHIEGVFVTVESGADDSGAVAVEDGEEVLLFFEPCKFDGGVVDDGVGSGGQALFVFS